MFSNNAGGNGAIVRPQLSPTLLSYVGDVRAFAADRVAVVDGFISSLTQNVLTLQPPTITPEFPTGGSAPALLSPTAPDLERPVWSAPGLPAPLVATLETGDLEIEPFDEEAPVLNFGAPPPPLDAQMPDAPAINLDFDDPTLTVNLPAAPDLLSLNVRPFDGLNLPTFDEAAPELVAVEPSIREYTPGDDYTSALLSQLQSVLQERIQGGTGLGADAEEALWNRGREREARTQADSVRALEQMEELGYAHPPGVYLDARLRIITETDFAERGHSREVMIKAAELELDQVKHALTTAVQLEGQLLDYTNQVEQRFFESTRYATEAGISIYNAKVQAFGAMVDVYRAKVGVYEALVRAETSKVDAYRAEIAAEEAKASLNRTLVEQYKVQIDAALSNIRIFEAEIAGIRTKAEIEQTKVQIFGEQVRGYVAEVNAYTAGIEGYRAQIGAETAKVGAYEATVSAYRARVEASARQIDSRIQEYRGRIEAKTAEYDGYRAQVQGESARVDGIARLNSAEADIYRADATATGSYNEVLTRQWQATLDQNQRTAEIGVSAARANAELYITSRSLALDAIKTGATVSAQIGSAALNAYNHSTSVSASESYNGSESLSVSSSNSNSNSTSNSTAYNYNASI